MISVSGVYDEHGVQWEIHAKDPVSRECNRLRALGFEYIVLPRKAIIDGYKEGMVECKVQAHPDDVPELVHQARLRDCLMVLS